MLSNFLTDRCKTWLHIVQTILVAIAIALACGRLAMTTPPPSRGNILALPTGLKSLVVIAYQLLTEHNQRFKKWASTKANAILNSIEVVFWLVVPMITAMGFARETGTAMALSVLIFILGLVLMFLSLWVATISIVIRRKSVRHSSKNPTLSHFATNGHDTPKAKAGEQRTYILPMHETA